MVSLLLYETEVQPRSSVNNKDTIQVCIVVETMIFKFQKVRQQFVLIILMGASVTNYH